MRSQRRAKNYYTALSNEPVGYEHLCLLANGLGQEQEDFDFNLKFKSKSSFTRSRPTQAAPRASTLFFLTVREIQELFLLNHHLMAKRVVILGAGVAGLTAARLLAKNSVKVIVLEARNRVGGRIHTWDMKKSESTTSTSSAAPIADQSITLGRNAVDLGASFCHGHIGNPVAALQKEAGFHFANPIEGSSPIWPDRGGGKKMVG